MYKLLAVSVFLGLALVIGSKAQFVDPFQYVQRAMANIPRYNGFGYNSGYNGYNYYRGPWYKGPNVCVDEEMKSTQSDEDEKDPEDSGMFTNMRSEMETCKGGLETYKCTANVYNNGVWSKRIRTYTCCENYVRSNDGSPGCVPKK